MVSHPGHQITGGCLIRRLRSATHSRRSQKPTTHERRAHPCARKHVWAARLSSMRLQHAHCVSSAVRGARLEQPLRESDQGRGHASVRLRATHHHCTCPSRLFSRLPFPNVRCTGDRSDGVHRRGRRPSVCIDGPNPWVRHVVCGYASSLAGCAA